MTGTWAADGDRVGPAHHFRGTGWSTCGHKYRPTVEARRPRRVCVRCVQCGAPTKDAGRRLVYEKGELKILPPGSELAVPQEAEEEGELTWTGEAVRLLASEADEHGDVLLLVEAAEERSRLLGLERVTPGAVRSALGHPHRLPEDEGETPASWV